MSLEDLFTQVLGSPDLNVIRDRMSIESRQGLAAVLVGRCVIHLGQAVGGSHNFPESAVDLLRRRALADALRELAGLCALYGIGPEELSAMLGNKEG